MPNKIDYSSDFLGFFRDVYKVEGNFGPAPIVPPFLEKWLGYAFPGGDPAARNIMDCRTKKEGKSALGGAVAMFMATRKDYQEVIIAAADMDQAKDRILRSVKYAVDHGPLSSHAKVYRDVIEFDNRSTIQALPMDWRGAAGGNYACVVMDELHTYTQEFQRRLFDELVVPPTRPDGVRWIASYAGYLGESNLLKELWDRALLGKRIDDELPIYSSPDSSLLAMIDTGPESWRMPWMSKQYIDEIRQSERPNTFRRLWLNEWVANESQFLPEGAWHACESNEVRPLQRSDRMKVVVGADASTSRDLTALVGCTWNSEKKTVDVVLVKTWKPEKGLFRQGKPTVDLSETIGAEVIRLHEAGQLDRVIADPFQLHNLIIEWEKLGIKVIEMPQTSMRVEADQGLYDAVIGRTIRHYGDHVLGEHLRNAVALETPRGFRIAKEKTSQKIDACVALSMAHYGCQEFLSVERGITILRNKALLDWLEMDSSGALDDTPCPLRPGIDCMSCKRRAPGCLWAYEALGTEQREEEERARYANQPEEMDPRESRFIQQNFAAPWVRPEDPRMERARNVSRLFWKEVDKKIQGDKHV